jgi:hypothetical protein
MAQVKGEGVKIVGKERKVRSDKKVKICPYFPQELHHKINVLSRTLNIKETELIISMCDTFLNHPQYINWIQDKHDISKDDPFRIIPQVVNGKVQF